MEPGRGGCVAVVLALLVAVCLGSAAPSAKTLVFDDCIVVNVTNITIVADGKKYHFNISDTAYTVVNASSACPSEPSKDEISTSTLAVEAKSAKADATVVFEFEGHAKSGSKDLEVTSWSLGELKVSGVATFSVQFNDKTPATSPLYAPNGFGLGCDASQHVSNSTAKSSIILDGFAVQPFNVAKDHKIDPAPGVGLDACEAAIAKARSHLLAIVIAGVTGGLVLIAGIMYCVKSRKKREYQVMP